MNNAILKARVWQNPLYFLAFGFGSGLMPFAPGTWGTIAAIPLYLLIADFSPLIYICMVVVAFFVGIFLCGKVSKQMGVHDYAGIVWDEIVGLGFTLFLAPKGVQWLIFGFVLFRLFDIWKPNPIRYIDKHVHGGLGIMLDDLLAAIPAWLILQSVAWLLTWFNLR